MTGSKNLNNKLKSTPKIATRTRQGASATPTASAEEKENNENLMETIRSIVKEELEHHQERVSEIIKLQLITTNERLDKISQEVVDITKSLEFTQGELHDGLENVQKDIKHVKSDLQEIEDDLLDPDFVVEKLTELEDRSRRNNIRIDGITENPNETWEKCEEEVKKLIETKLNIDGEIEIDRCHRMGKFKRNNVKPRTIVCRFLRFKDKQKILRNAKLLKNTGIFIYEDFCDDTMELRKTLWEEVLQHRRENKIAYLNYRSVVVRDRRDVR